MVDPSRALPNASTIWADESVRPRVEILWFEPDPAEKSTSPVALIAEAVDDPVVTVVVVTPSEVSVGPEEVARNTTRPESVSAVRLPVVLPTTVRGPPTPFVTMVLLNVPNGCSLYAIRPLVLMTGWLYDVPLFPLFVVAANAISWTTSPPGWPTYTPAPPCGWPAVGPTNAENAIVPELLIEGL